jgi:hypothetical protein
MHEAVGASPGLPKTPAPATPNEIGKFGNIALLFLRQKRR